jgi:hypothetical protein
MLAVNAEGAESRIVLHIDPDRDTERAGIR